MVQPTGWTTAGAWAWLTLAAMASTPTPEAFYVGSPADEPVAFDLQNSGWRNPTGGSSNLGLPAVLTWSLPPDGTTLPRGLSEPASPNNLIAMLDGIHHGGASPGGTDLTQRAWWTLIDSAFKRWESLAGLTFTYEPNDDGISLPLNRGFTGVRGDYRIAGHYIDGDVRPSVLAYNYFPDISDMVLDTSELTIFGDSTANYRDFRNTLMHEIGHGLGIAHVESRDTVPGNVQHDFGSFLMEPRLSRTFDGPQFDDILGAHRLYGDVYEKGLGNDTYLRATDLGTLPNFTVVELGTDANDIRVEPDEVDFVSIDSNSDMDVYRFTIHRPMVADLRLQPRGPTYLNGGQGSASEGTQVPWATSAFSDLSLELFGSDGSTLLASSQNVGLGVDEWIRHFELPDPGAYYVRVSGFTTMADGVQMYRLRVATVPEPASGLVLAAGLLATGVCRWRLVNAGQRRRMQRVDVSSVRN